MRRVLTFLLATVMSFGIIETTSQAFGQEDGFESIFDGKTLDGWKGQEGFWSVKDGAIVGEQSADNPLKKNDFIKWQGGELTDFELRFKYRISGEGSNSGVQFRCEVEPDGHMVGYQADIDLAGQWLGCIYDEKTGRGLVCDRGEKVSINEAGERAKEIVADKAEIFSKIDVTKWNEYTIKAVGNHLTITVNGMATSELIDSEKDHADASGLLGLQLHTGPPMKIEFKDLQLKKLDSEKLDSEKLGSDVSSNQDQTDGFKSIFDDKSLTGWAGNEKFWRVENGAIVGETTEDNPVDVNRFLVWDQGEVDDFCLRLKFKVSGTEKANSGIQFRSEIFDGEMDRLSGYQADIDRSGRFIGILYSERTGRGIMCKRGEKVTIRGNKDKEVEQVADAAEILTKIDMDGWNEMEVTAQGNHFITKINGHVTSEVIDEDAKQFKRKGLLGFQIHQGPPMKIEFKDIKLKRLPLSDSKKGAGKNSSLKKVVFLAGKPSHGYGAHEHNAGCMLLAEALEAAATKNEVSILTTVYTNGWPADPTALDNADTVVVYCDGGKRHYLHHNGEAFEDIMRRGVGLACIHYGVEVPKGMSGQRFFELDRWLF